MKRLTTLATDGRVRRAIVGACLVVGISALVTLAIPRPIEADPTATGVSVNTAASVAKAVLESSLAAPPHGGWSDPAKTMGAKACIQCHRSEYLAWMSSKHAKTEKTIASFTGNTANYANALGIKAEDVMHNSICASCHVTPQVDAGGKHSAIGGVSCESCHGAAGGQSGWLNRHAVYGPNVTPIDLETPEHREARINYSENAGMVRAQRTYSIAKNCLQCHSVTNEKLVNAGHKIGSDFELVGWSIGEVRHNFHRDQFANAKGPSLWKYKNGGDTDARKRVKFIVGTLANIEVSLSALASATEGDTDFTSAHKERVGLGMEILGGIIDALEDNAPEELGQVIEAVEGAEIEDADFSEKEARDTATATAKNVAGIAMKISANDGSKLAGVDGFMNDEVVSVKGEPFTRKP